MSQNNFLERCNTLTFKNFFLANLSVWATVIAAIIVGSITWGQTQERVNSMEKQQDKFQDVIEQLRTEQGDIKVQQQKNSVTLEKLDERSQNSAQTQHRILNAIERLSNGRP